MFATAAVGKALANNWRRLIHEIDVIRCLFSEKVPAFRLRTFDEIYLVNLIETENRVAGWTLTDTSNTSPAASK
ncbi:hypothetical protein P0D73_15610 [Paraburkholderia sp. RL18-101-BIB-B]|jgi:hypothetical protein|uniref:hypothetical protein n=1 Tax=Paraburkholderia sp. RL18-101-BIB-B TaxID=3031634 RepID=UPI0038B95400